LERDEHFLAITHYLSAAFVHVYAIFWHVKVNCTKFGHATPIHGQIPSQRAHLTSRLQTLQELAMRSPPTLLTLALDVPNQHLVCLNLHILDQTPLPLALYL